MNRYKEDLEKILIEDDQCLNEGIFYRRITSNTNERTMISTLFPKNCYCVSIKYINSERTPIFIYKKLFIIFIFNVLVFDFMIIRFVLNTDIGKIISLSMSNASTRRRNFG